MKNISVVCIAIATFTTACTPIVKELRHPGGYPGHVLDKRMFDASESKELQVLRATIILAMIARTGATSTDNREDGQTFVRYTVGAVDEINILAGHIDRWSNNTSRNCLLARGSKIPSPSADLYNAEMAARNAATNAATAAGRAEDAAIRAQDSASKAQAAANSIIAAAGGSPIATPSVSTSPDDPGDPPGCFTYAVNFESDIRLLENKLFKLALLSLPKKAAKRLLDDVGNGDVLGAVFSAARFAFTSIDGLRSAAAVQRTGLEIEAFQMPNAGKCLDDDIRTVKGAAKCLDLPEKALFSDKAVKELELNVDERLFHALMRNIYDSCRLAPLDVNATMSSVKIEGLKNERITACNQIKFAPRSRWVGIPDY